MAAVIRYWFRHCPSCGPEGELLISKRRDSGRLCFQCAECSWACSRPEDTDNVSKGSRVGFDPFEAPLRWEIETAGWMQYCQNEMLVESDDDDAISERARCLRTLFRGCTLVLNSQMSKEYLLKIIKGLRNDAYSQVLSNDDLAMLDTVLDGENGNNPPQTGIERQMDPLAAIRWLRDCLGEGESSGII